MTTPDHNGWHLRREVSVGHIMTTVVVAASAFAYIFSLEGRISLQGQKIEAVEARIDRADARLKDDLSEIKGALLRIENKVDQGR